MKDATITGFELVETVKVNLPERSVIVPAFDPSTMIFTPGSISPVSASATIPVIFNCCENAKTGNSIDTETIRNNFLSILIRRKSNVDFIAAFYLY